MVDALMAATGGPMSGMLAVAERAASDPLIIETIRLRTLAARRSSTTPRCAPRSPRA